MKNVKLFKNQSGAQHDLGTKTKDGLISTLSDEYSGFLKS